VVHRAEEVARKILDTYLEPEKSFVELREMAIDGSINRGFSHACHDKFEEMRAGQPLCSPCVASLCISNQDFLGQMR
jgi:hypothetical protein